MLRENISAKMSKRPLITKDPDPAISSSRSSTMPASGAHRDPPLPPLKLPVLAAIPMVPGEETVNLDKIPTPQPPELSVIESVNNSEHHALEEENATSNSQAQVPECERKSPEVETLKNSVKRQSWASNYLTSIGISYLKPIKINLSSSMKNVAAAEQSQSTHSAEEKQTESKNLNEYSAHQPCNSAETANIPQSIQIYSPELKNRNEVVFKSKTDFNDIKLPYYDGIHSETLQIANENLSYINYCPRRYHGEQRLYEATLCTEIDRYQNISCFKPTEDKSYLDKVDQFLAKISSDKGEIEPHRDINPRKRSLPLKHRDIENNNIRHNLENQPDPKITDFETGRQCNDLLELKEKEYLKMSKRFCDAEVSEKPSTSKQNYYICKERNYENASRFRTDNTKFEDEYKTRENKRLQYNISRAEYYRARSPNYVHRHQEMVTYKTRQRSNSSSSERCRSPINNKQKTIYKKRVRSDSSNRSENDRESTLPVQYKKCDKTRRSRDRSNSSSHKNVDRSSRHISSDDKYKPYTKNKPRSNSKISCHYEKPRDKSPCQIQRSRENRHTTKRRNSYCSSDSSSHDRISLRNKRYKKGRESSSSSSSNDSDNFQDTPIQHSKKTNTNKKDITKKEIKEKCNSKNRSENIRTTNNCDKVKCHESKSKNKEKIDETSIKNKRTLSPDAKKTYKLIKDIIFKDKVKRKLLKSLISLNSSTNLNDGVCKTSSASNPKQKKEIVGPSEKYSTKKHKGNEESDSNLSAPIKSAVLVKDNIPQKTRTNLCEIERENFDLRSKLSRKNLNQHISRIRTKNKLEKEMHVRENLVVTVDNQDQKEAIQRDDSDKLITQEETEKLKIKKFKKIKLVINVICENSDDDDKKSNDADSNLNKECALPNEELSFLDDLNIDEIVDSLTRDKNEASSSKNCTDAALENKILIDLCDLISSSEDSDASTVHLEEICDTHDDLKDCNKIKNGADSSKKNMIFQSERIDMSYKKPKTEYLTQLKKSNDVTADKIEPSNQSTLIKQETENSNNSENNKLPMADNALSTKLIQNDIVSVNDIKIEVIEEKCYKETDSTFLFTSATDKDKIVINDNYKQKNIRPLIEIKDEPIGLDMDNTIPVFEIKDDPMDEIKEEIKPQEEVTSYTTKEKHVPADKIKNKVTDKHANKKPSPQQVIKNNSSVSCLSIKNEVMEEKCYKETDSKFLFTSTTDKDKIVTNDNYKRKSITPLVEIKDEPIGLDMDNTIPVIEIKDEPMDEIIEEIKPLQEVTSYTTKEKHIAAVEIKNKVTDDHANKKPSSQQIIKSNSSVSCLRKENKDNDTSVVDIEDKTMEEVQSVEINTSQKSEPELISSNEIKTEMREEDSFTRSTLPQSMINHVSHLKDKNETITKPHSDENKIFGEIDIADVFMDNNNKNTYNAGIFQNKSLISNPEKYINNQQNTEAKVTNLNETFIKKSFTESDILNVPKKLIDNKQVLNLNSVLNMENILDETNTKNAINAPMSDCCTEYVDLSNLNNTYKQISRETLLDNNLSNSSTTGASNCAENGKSLHVLSKTSERVTESNALEIEQSKNDKVSNTNDENDQKLDKVANTLTNNQDSKITESQKFVAEVETGNKSRSHSPIRIKTTNPIIKSEKKPEFKGKILVQKLQDRLFQYLQEPFTVSSLLHKGKFSKIFHCKCSLGKDYAVKMLSFETDGCSRGIAKQRFLKSLQKDIPDENLNFVRVIDGLSVSGLWCILMDFYPKNLSQYLEENGKSLHVNQVQHLSRQLVAAVTVLRHKNIIHSDIKPGHVLLNSTNNRLKLCGFDGAYHIGEVDILPNIGSVNYRAPEIILGYSAGFGIDVWSTALVMFEMATRRKLFPGTSNNDILFKQMCTLGFVPFDMIDHSRFGYNHFSGTMFKRRTFGQPYWAFLGERDIYKNTILRSTINTTYHKEWAKGIPRKQKTEELSQIDSFCNLLEEMLAMHPTNRLPIEFVYANPYLTDGNQGREYVDTLVYSLNSNRAVGEKGLKLPCLPTCY